jgi:hypothetical protein
MISAQTSLLSPMTRRSGLKRSTNEKTTNPSSMTTSGRRINSRLVESWIARG